MFLDLGSTTVTSRGFNRARRRTWRGVAAVAAGVLALSTGATAGAAASNSGTTGTAGTAGASSQTTFKFTGTVKGTLSAPDTPCSQQVVTAKGATFMLTGTLKGAPADQWTIQLYTPKAGTSKKFGQESGNGPNVTLIGTDANGDQNWNWTSVTKNGSITTTKTSGKITITLGPYSSFRGKAGKGHVHMTGSWGCSS